MLEFYIKAASLDTYLGGSFVYVANEGTTSVIKVTCKETDVLFQDYPNGYCLVRKLSFWEKLRGRKYAKSRRN